MMECNLCESSFANPKLCRKSSAAGNTSQQTDKKLGTHMGRKEHTWEGKPRVKSATATLGREKELCLRSLSPRGMVTRVSILLKLGRAGGGRGARHPSHPVPGACSLDSPSFSIQGMLGGLCPSHSGPRWGPRGLCPPQPRGDPAEVTPPAGQPARPPSIPRCKRQRDKAGPRGMETPRERRMEPPTGTEQVQRDRDTPRTPQAGET